MQRGLETIRTIVERSLCPPETAMNRTRVAIAARGARVYPQRCGFFEKTPPAADWDGICTVQGKY